MSEQAGFQKAEMVEIWWCNIRTVGLGEGWGNSVYPNFGGSQWYTLLCGPIFFFVRKNNFQISSCGSNTTTSIPTCWCFIIAARVYSSPYRQGSHKNYICILSRDYSLGTSCRWRNLKFLLPWGCRVVPLHQLPIGFGFKMVNPAWLFQDLCVLGATNADRALKEVRKTFATNLQRWC